MELSLPKRWGVIIAIVFTTSIITCLFIGISLVFGLLGTLLFAMIVLKGYGVKVKTTLGWIKEGILSVKGIYSIILMIGINVSMWIASGIVPTLIYYGFDIIDKVNFLLFAFLMTTVVSFFLGTGLGTLSTIGVALFSLGISVGIPEALLVGALLSGAYVADRLSPISALVNFTTETIGVKFKDYFKRTGFTMMPAFILSSFFYLFMGEQLTQTISESEILFYRVQLLDNFTVSPWFFIVPFIVLWISFRGAKTNTVLGIGIVMGLILGIFVQGDHIIDMLKYSIFGYSTVSDGVLIQSLQIGGAYAMVEVVFIIMAGVSMSKIYDECGWVKPIAFWVTEKSKTKIQLGTYSGLLSIALNALTCDQTVGIIIPGKYLKAAFKKHDLNEADLGQIIANSGTAFAPLMPWNVNAIIILAITGVGALQYAPYTIFNWISFPIAILMMSFKIKDQKIDK